MTKNTDRMIEAAKASYYKTKLKNTDSVYFTIKALLNKNQKILLTGDSNTARRNKFARYFVGKKSTLYDLLSIQLKLNDLKTEFFMATNKLDAPRFVNMHLNLQDVTVL